MSHSPPPAIPQRRALVIEDDPDIRGLLAMLLEQRGFEVSEASGGVAGVESAARSGPDLVILDMGLPDIDGLETCRRLRSFTNAYVMMVSAHNQEADLLAGLQEGADDYVAKPFSARELGARIDAVFRRPRSAEPQDEARKADVDDEEQRAAAVQRGLLPRSAPEVPGYGLAGCCRPTRSVGGDFYDWHLQQDRLTVTLADAMGKGMGAALLAATLRSALRGANGPSPLRTCAAALDLAGPDLSALDAFATVFQAVLDTASGTLRYVDAGHGLAWIVDSAGGTRRLGARGLPFGIEAEAAWEEQTERLLPGESLVAVSDGFLDAAGGIDAAAARIRTEVAGSASAQDAVQALAAVAGDAAGDDLTVVVLRRAAT